MQKNWKKTTISDLIKSENASLQTGPFGTALKASEYSTEGVPLISVREIRNGYFELTEHTPCVNEKTLSRLPKFILRYGDIVFGRKGAVDRSAMVQKDQDGWFLGSDGIRLRLDDSCDHRFISYQVRSPTIQNWLIQHAEGTTMLSMNQKVLGRIPLILPPISEQERIAHILGSLDDKIERNRQMNATLEGMTQALFKSWFVDFDPVIDNALAAGNPIPEAFAARAKTRRKALADGAANRDVAKQFPAAFQFTEEMGWIPGGWEVKTSSSLFDVKDGTHDSPKQSITGKYLITSRHIIGNTIDYSNAYLISEEDFNKVNKRSKVDSYDILLTMIGTVGCPFIVMEEEINFAIKNVGLFKTGINRTLATYFFIYLKSHFMKSFMESRLAGTTQKYLTLKILRALPVIVPHSDIMERFGEQTNSIFNKIHFNNNTTNYLISIRDTLLPKLISGEIRIPEAEKITEEALA